MTHLESVILRFSDSKFHGGRMYFAHPAWVDNTPLLWLLTGRRPGHFARDTWSNLHLFPFERERRTFLALAGGPGLNNPAGIERFVSELEGRTAPPEDPRFFLLAFASGAAPALELPWYSSGTFLAPGAQLTLLSEVLPPGLQQPAPQPPLTDNALPQRRTTNSEALRRLALPLLRPGQGTALPSWNFTAQLPHNPFRFQRRAPLASRPAPQTPTAPPSPPSLAELAAYAAAFAPTAPPNTAPATPLPELSATTPRPRPTQALLQAAPPNLAPATPLPELSDTTPRPRPAQGLPQAAPHPRPSTAPHWPAGRLRLEQNGHSGAERPNWPHVPTLARLNALLDTALGLQADGTPKGQAKRQRTLAAWHAGHQDCEEFDTLNAAMQNLLCTGATDSTPAPSGAAKRHRHN